MDSNVRTNSSNHILYRALPTQVVERLTELPSNSGVFQFLNDTLPISESANAVTDLNKKVGVDLRKEMAKIAKPRKKKFGLSQKERRVLGLYRLPKFSISYCEALPMLRLWEDYMYRFLNLNHLQNKQWFNPKTGHLWDTSSVILMKADYHGALLKVADSKCHSLVDFQGIVIFDTKFTFTVVSKDDVTRTIPKQSCIFQVFLKKYKFKIFGKYFCIRSNERSSKKIKCSLVPIL